MTVSSVVDSKYTVGATVKQLDKKHVKAVSCHVSFNTMKMLLSIL